MPTLLLGTLLLSSCSLEKHLAKVSTRIEQDYAATRTWNELPVRTISWAQALAMVDRNNAELLRAKSQIEQADRDTLSVYTDMVPGMSYYGYMTRSINELSNQFSADELSSQVNVTFSMPAWTQVPYRVYSSKARAFAAIKAREGKRREIISKLYQQVRSREVAEKLDRLQASTPGIPSDRKEQLSKNDRQTAYWQALSTALGNHEARWTILPESMPRIEWDQYADKLDKLDPLVVCQFAMRLEQARLSQYGVALRYLPTINTSLYSPSLFSSSGGTYSGTFLSGEDTRLNLSISYTADTHLNIWNQYKRSKADYEQAQREVAANLLDHKNKVATLKKSMAEYEQWKQFMHKKLAYVSQRLAPTAEAYLNQQKELYEMQRELLNQENAAIESEAAIALEYGLPGETPLPSGRSISPNR